MRRALQTIAVVALLVVAGCSGASGPTDPVTETTVATTTDAPTATTDAPATTTDAPTTTTLSEKSTYPPGISAEGVENATRLVEAHRESVVERGVVMESTQTIDGTVNGQTLRIDGSETARLTAGAAEFRWSVTANTTRGNETRQLDERYYANETRLFSRVDRKGNVTIRSRNLSSFWNRAVIGAPSKARIVNASLTNANYTVADVSEQGNRTVTTLVAKNGSYTGARPVASYDVTLTVADSGRILSLTRSRTVDTERTTSHSTLEITWSRAVSVDRPEWTDDATPVNASQYTTYNSR